ncbi:PIN/TRAM domain-containing protein [Planctomycetales bacterium]|nr:PIN/TRAM domain-containing protein [Planctomycetales bacterium]
MFGRLIPRVLFIAFMVLFSFYIYRMLNEDEMHFRQMISVIVAGAVVGIALVVWEWRFQRDLARQMVAILFGLTAGLFATVVVAAILMLVLVPYNILQNPQAGTLDVALFLALWQMQFWLPLILSACLYVGVTVILQTKDDFRFLIPYVDLSHRSAQAGGILLDTSVLIDGRIVEMAPTGIFPNRLIIPDYVWRELHHLSDSADAEKRARGRRGLDIAKKLTDNPHLNVIVHRAMPGQQTPVDEALLQDAQALSARVMTTDYNLGKVGALFAGVEIINLNDLAKALKPQYVGGETLTIYLLKRGQNPDQAVGYLDDGTMVVVDGGAPSIGKRETIQITGNIQTAAGKMLFAVPVKE